MVAEGGEEDLASVAETTERLDALKIPIGWNEAAKEDFKEMDWTTAAMVAGWLTTAVLVSLGAPFWFDLLTRLVSLRNAGSKPLPAAQDLQLTCRDRDLVEISTTGGNLPNAPVFASGHPRAECGRAGPPVAFTGPEAYVSDR